MPLMRHGSPSLAEPAGGVTLRRTERVGQTIEQLDAIRAREKDLAALVGRIAQGEQEALAALWDETSSSVYGLALRVLRDPPAAEEVTIEVYTQVHRQAALYDPGRGTPTAWLLTLARSRAIDRLRAESQRRQREDPLETIEALPTDVASPEEASAAAELRRTVRAALLALSPEQRRVVEIAYYSGLSHSEIAAELGEPLGTVKTRIRTAMMRLRELLRPLSTEGQP
jgi:RNA polymerase sigma-70 factor (ECF subfamily)